MHCKALSTCTQNIIHCDVKPQNIFIGSDDICKIADFGSTVDVGFARSTTEEKVLAPGTPAYMSPEACRGSESAEGDIWGIGITMIELLTGQLPWGRNQLKDTNRFIADLGSNEIMLPTIPSTLEVREDNKNGSMAATREVDTTIVESNNKNASGGANPSWMGDNKQALELIVACLRRNPEERPTASEALQFPFFR